jgi:hypothetical protein
MEELFSVFHIGNVGVGVVVRGRGRHLAYMGRVYEFTVGVLPKYDRCKRKTIKRWAPGP